MSDRAKRRPVWRTVLQALAAAAGVLVLLAIVGFVLASSPVRSSPFGKRMERRYPIRWSEVALVFGRYDERRRAVGALGMTGSGRALAALDRAAADRSARVRAMAVQAMADLAPYAPHEAERRLLALCGDRRADTRREALRACRGMLALGVPPSAALQQVVAAGLQDRDPECRREAAATVQDLVSQGTPLQPEVWVAFAACLRSPSPGPEPRIARLSGPARYIAVPPTLREARSALGRREPRAHIWALRRLWEMGTPEARRLIEGDLAKRPLGG